MQAQNKNIEALDVWRSVVTRSLQSNSFDLSARQTGIMLSVYLNPPPHTIRNLAEKLNISKPAVCRAIDTMEKWGLVKRKKDEQDKRNVLIQRTVKGSVYLSELGDVIVEEVNKNPQLLGEEQDKKIA